MGHGEEAGKGSLVSSYKRFVVSAARGNRNPLLGTGLQCKVLGRPGSGKTLQIMERCAPILQMGSPRPGGGNRPPRVPGSRRQS